MRLQNLNNFTIVFVILIAFTSISGNFTADHYQQASEEANEVRRRSLMYSDILLAGAKFLTDSVRSFAATGDPKYQQAYDAEVNRTRSRDNAVEGLKSLDIPDEELALIEEAKQRSDALMELERRAFEAGDNGDLKSAVALVYGPEYQQVMQSIYEPIYEFRQRLQQRTYIEMARARDKAKKKRYLTNIANIGSYLVVLTLMIFIYSHKIIRPIVGLSRALQAIMKGDNQYRIKHLDDENEIGDLARSLEQYRKVTHTMDTQNWIETNTGKVVAQIQQAETQADLAKSLLSFISPLLEVGHSALYIYDALSHQLCMTGGYGCRPTEDDNCFALGESLVGQCAQEKKVITLSDLPDDYIRIGSALGDAVPRHLYLFPILLQDNILGVLELASFKSFSERERDFLDELMATLAMTMEVLNRNMQTHKLLQETQEQAQRMEKQAALLEEQAIEMEAQQAELKETEAWYRGIIESAPQGMLVCDENGMIILSNPKAESIFGYAPNELMGCHIDNLVPASLRDEYPLLRKKFLTSNGYQPVEPDMSLTGVRKDGSEFQLEASFSQLSALGSHEKCIFISLKETHEQSTTH